MSYCVDKHVLPHTETDRHTDRQTQATTISEGQKWPRVIGLTCRWECENCCACFFFVFFFNLATHCPSWMVEFYIKWCQNTAQRWFYTCSITIKALPWPPDFRVVMSYYENRVILTGSSLPTQIAKTVELTSIKFDPTRKRRIHV